MTNSHRSGGLRRALVRTIVAALALSLAGCTGPATQSAGSATQSAGSATPIPTPAPTPVVAPTPTLVRVGFLYDVHAAAVWTLDQCKSDKVSFELVNFKQFAEVQRAFQGGQVDFAAMGYQNFGQMLDKGYPDFRAIAGVYTGGEHITIKAGSGISTWADLNGKKIGIPPNSFVEMLFRSALKENNVKIEDMTIVPFPGAGPPMLTALQRGDIDAMVAWESNSAKAKVEGIGEYPSFDIQQGSIGKATSVMYVTELLANNKPDVVQEVVRCLVEQTEALSANKTEWVNGLVSKTGLTKEVAETAIATGQMDITLYQKSAENIIKTFAENGLLSDTSGQVASKFDYSFLEKVTGKTKAELGAE